MLLRFRALLRYIPFASKILYIFTYCMAELYAVIWLKKGWLARGFQKNVLEKAIRDQLEGHPDLVDKMMPKYEVGCNRILISNDFLPMFVKVIIVTTIDI